MSDLNAFCLDLLQQLFCEMKAGCRSSCRTIVFCIYSLVTGLVLKLMCDIRRKRHLAQLVQERCLNRLFPVDRGILLTAQKGARLLFPEDTAFPGRVDAPYGYIIDAGSVRLGEFYEL